MCDVEQIDLRKCKPGDKLRIRIREEYKKATVPWHNPITDVVTYIGPCEANCYFDHYIEYSNGSKGTRTHDGKTFKKNTSVNDPDVIEIL